MAAEQAHNTDQQDVELRLVVKHTFLELKPMMAAAEEPEEGARGRRRRAASDAGIKYDIGSTQPQNTEIQRIDKVSVEDGETESVGSSAEGSGVEFSTAGSSSQIDSPGEDQCDGELDLVETSSTATGQDEFAEGFLHSPLDASVPEFVPMCLGGMGSAWVPVCTGGSPFFYAGHELSWPLPPNFNGSAVELDKQGSLLDMTAAEHKEAACQADEAVQYARFTTDQPQELPEQVLVAMGSLQANLPQHSDLQDYWNSLASTTPSSPNQTAALPPRMRPKLLSPDGTVCATTRVPAGSGSTWESKSRNDRTTIMLRNVPNDYNRELLMELLDSEGFAGRYDFVYLPLDFQRFACLGYAFVNMVSQEDAAAAKEHFQGFKAWKNASLKICDVSWGGPLQGLAANIDRYRNSPVMHCDVPDECKPVILSWGRRCPFPPPTKRVRPPRMKRCSTVEWN